MDELLQRHLDAIARQMGGLLRGFDDPSVHVGTPELFARQFDILLRLPLLRGPDGGRAISYAQALRTARAPRIEVPSSDAIAVLVHGLSAPATLAGGERSVLALAPLTADLARLLRVPLFRFYVRLRDRERFLAGLRAGADRLGRPVVVTAPHRNARCSGCDRVLTERRVPDGFDDGAGRPGGSVSDVLLGGALSCTACDLRFETLVVLPMVSACLVTLSFDMLGEAVALDEVQTYQEETRAVPVVTAGARE